MDSKIVVDKIEEMRTAFNTISKEFKEKHIPMNTIRIVVEDYKLPKKKGIERFVHSYNKTLNTFIIVCEKTSQKDLLGKVHIDIINQFIDIIIENIK